VTRALFGRDPYTPEAISQRRAAVLDFVAAALFVDREEGVKLASEIAREKNQDGKVEPVSSAPASDSERGGCP
jgi:hypothetical protein